MYEEDKTFEKAKYESVLPPGANFIRFTTSSLNLKKFTQLSENQRIKFLNINNIDAIDINSITEYQEFYEFERYWYDIGMAFKDELPTKLDELRNYVVNNNNMGLGFGIQINGDNLEYKFDFKFKMVSVYRKRIKKMGYKTAEDILLVARMREEDNWTWKDVEQSNK